MRIDPPTLSLGLDDLFADLWRAHHDRADLGVLIGSTVFARAFQYHPEAGEPKVAEQTLVIAKVEGEVDDLRLHWITLGLLNHLVGLGEFDQLFAAWLDVFITVTVALAPRLHTDGFEHRGVVDAEGRQLDRQLRTEQRIHQPSRWLDFQRLTTAAHNLHRARTVQA